MSTSFDVVFVDGDFVSTDAARISIKANAVSYGTGTFEGLRATWNEERNELYLLEPLAHYVRMRSSANALGLTLPLDPPELVEITVELLRRNEAREDAYIRPILLLAGEVLPVRMHDIATSFSIAVSPFPSGYINTVGIRALVSSWRRASDDMMPIRAKVNGSYVGPALAKTEAMLAGFDEAILLNAHGEVAEATTSNVFIRRGERWATPAVTDDILEGITRRQVIALIQERGGVVEERTIDRSELYVCDEAFLCATAVQLSPLVEVDHRPVGSGEAGEETLALIEELRGVARGESEDHTDWVVPVWGS
ncbi:MAG TPA: branched-chain amino acid transaminase [Gaiellaceae bacterium]|jgi:branched-chain amino acid aminotransferase|nr:branched-chain amino acid transaminase [Gaiellaceae bacterium]